MANDVEPTPDDPPATEYEKTPHGRDTGQRRRRTDRFPIIRNLSGADRVLLGAAVASLFIILGVLMFAIVNTNHRASEAVRANERGILCVIEQFAGHISANETAHRRAAEEHGYGLPRQAVPSATAEAVKNACKPFLNRRTLDAIEGRPEPVEADPPESSTSSSARRSIIGRRSRATTTTALTSQQRSARETATTTTSTRRRGPPSSTPPRRGGTPTPP